MKTLNQAIEKAVDTIKKNRSLYEKNEAAMRTHIIEPILAALGWNIHNPKEVIPNDNTEKGFPDYTLLSNEKMCLFIEAKNLATDLRSGKCIEQLLVQY